MRNTGRGAVEKKDRQEVRCKTWESKMGPGQNGVSESLEVSEEEKTSESDEVAEKKKKKRVENPI